MTSRDHAGPQFHQLAMFMTARELKEDLIPGDHNPGYQPDVERMWDRKRRENTTPQTGRGVSVRSVRKNGVIRPVEVEHGVDGPKYLGDGHHRVIAAYDVSPESLVPVMHYVPRSLRV